MEFAISEPVPVIDLLRIVTTLDNANQDFIPVIHRQLLEQAARAVDVRERHVVFYQRGSRG